MREHLKQVSFVRVLVIVIFFNGLVELKNLLADKRLWYNGLYSGLLFAVLIGFCASWGTFFMKSARGISLHDASHITAIYMLGLVIGAPLFGWLTVRLSRLSDLMHLMALFLGVVLSTVIALPNMPAVFVYTIMLVAGIASGAYLMPFVVARQIVPVGAKMAVLGVTNMFSVICGPIMISLSSKILEIIANTDQVRTLTYTTFHYQVALSIYPIGLFLAAYFAYKLTKEI